MIEKWMKEYQQPNVGAAAKLRMKHAVVKKGQMREEMKKYPAKVALTQVYFYNNVFKCFYRNLVVGGIIF